MSGNLFNSLFSIPVLTDPAKGKAFKSLEESRFHLKKTIPTFKSLLKQKDLKQSGALTLEKEAQKSNFLSLEPKPGHPHFKADSSHSQNNARSYKDAISPSLNALNDPQTLPQGRDSQFSLKKEGNFNVAAFFKTPAMATKALKEPKKAWDDPKNPSQGITQQSLQKRFSHDDDPVLNKAREDENLNLIKDPYKKSLEVFQHEGHRQARVLGNKSPFVYKDSSPKSKDEPFSSPNSPNNWGAGGEKSLLPLLEEILTLLKESDSQLADI